MSYVHTLYLCDFLESRFCGHNTFVLRTININVSVILAEFDIITLSISLPLIAVLCDIE